MIRRLLIANRGEIAVRIARTARDLGLATIAVYSEPDRNAVHVRACDEAVEVGPATAVDSYLSIPAILEAARKSRADAVHPGYGFLSENAGFARAVRADGRIWVGPDPESIEAMGDKVTSRARMEGAGVPVVPGFARDGASGAEFAEAARRLGYPVLVKASAGGGGKGMRLVEDPEDLAAALATGRRESRAAFGDERVYLEKAISRPRHVEIQIFGDRRGRVVALFERECSIQRRHQKIVEETPSPALDSTTRTRMAHAAIAAGRAAAYVGAGTVEFLLDGAGAFYFLEMNTRLQVEHPITEETLGIDLVAAQLSVAAGEDLPRAWDGLSPRGHAIECRIYAEDPETFLPRTGEVLDYEEPRGPGLRVDSGIERGSRVGIEYDPLLAKLIVRAENRETAAGRMRRALSEFVILGVGTNLRLLQRVLASEDFRLGRTDTGLVARLGVAAPLEPPRAAQLAAAWVLARPAARGGALRRPPDPWATLGDWRSS
jgi:3-methylcrotonyl-CoA carboxylase alpha subunit